MTDDNERIAKKAHELWEAEGRPHGRDQAHWDQAKEIIALQDSEGDTLLPRDFGAEEPVEEKTVAIDNEGQFPGLTDTGENDLTSTEREPAFTAPAAAAAAPTKATTAPATAPKAPAATAPAAATPAAAPAKPAKSVAKNAPAPKKSEAVRAPAPRARKNTKA